MTPFAALIWSYWTLGILLGVAAFLVAKVPAGGAWRIARTLGIVILGLAGLYFFAVGMTGILSPF